MIKKPRKIASSCAQMGRTGGNRRCDGRHAHIAFSGARTETSAQYPQRLCRAVARQIMSTDYLENYCGIWPADAKEDEEISPPRVPEKKKAPWSIDTNNEKLTANEKKDIDNWLRKVHIQFGHR